MVANEDCTCNIHVAALKSACVVTLLGCYRVVFQYCDRYITFTQLRSLIDACLLANASMRVHIYRVSMGNHIQFWSSNQSPTGPTRSVYDFIAIKNPAQGGAKVSPLNPPCTIAPPVPDWGIVREYK